MSCSETKDKTSCMASSLSNAKKHKVVKDYYGQVLESAKNLKTTACASSGCGAPLPLGVSGLRLLDLGSGSGRDCYVLSSLVGEHGFVTGVDMTDEQIAIADKYLKEYTNTLGFAEPNMKFVKGNIEYLDKAGIPDASVDLVISNCVVNLSPDKPRVLKEVYRVLASGGEFYFSDMYCDRRLPEHIKEIEALWGEGLSGALYIEDFKRIARSVGFLDARVLTQTEIKITDLDIQKICGEVRFYSITYRLFKIPDLMETLCEDYGQIATYKGTIQGHENAYQLDDHHRFEKGKPMVVCGNRAAMLGEKGISWLSPHFDVVGDRSVHYGLFGCGTDSLAKPMAATSGVANGSSCSG